jgi:hypothetical protein
MGVVALAGRISRWGIEYKRMDAEIDIVPQKMMR